MRVYTECSNAECLLGLNSAEGNGKLQCVLHFSLLLTMGDSVILLEAADLCKQHTRLFSKRRNVLSKTFLLV